MKGIQEIKDQKYMASIHVSFVTYFLSKVIISYLFRHSNLNSSFSSEGIIFTQVRKNLQKNGQMRENSQACIHNAMYDTISFIHMRIIDTS